MGLTDNLKFYFDLNQAAGGRVDATRKVADFTEVGTIVTATGGVPGGGLSADFNAAGNFNAPDAANLLFGERWTISFWSKIDGSLGNSYGYVAKRIPAGTSPGSEFGIQSNFGTFAIFMINAANGLLVQYSTAKPVTASWEHWVVRFNRSAGTNSLGCIRTSLNGSPVATANLTSGQTPLVPTVAGTPSNKPLVIGSAHGTTNRLDGQMVKVGGWDQEITDAEVVQLYNNGSGLLFSQLGGGLSVRGRERNSRAR